MSEVNTKLVISILGGRLGESIIIQTPGGSYGVIDSYASALETPNTNPTIKKLEEFGTEKLRFVALSHPHADHYKGMFTLFQRYKQNIEQFWRFPLGQATWSVFFDRFTQDFEINDTVGGRVKIAQKIKDLRRILDLAKAEVNNANMEPLTTQDERIMLEEDNGFSIICLGPSTKIVDSYQESLAKKVIVDQSHTAEFNHNLISSVFAVKYGNWLGILGGDTEQRSWNDILERCGNKWIKDTNFVKISHHGSPTGSFSSLWENINSNTCDVVVTCFAAQGLPNASGLQFVHEKGYKLHSTNSQLATHLYNRSIRSSSPIESTTQPLNALDKEYNGEVRITVDKNGEALVDYYGAAGPIYATQAKGNL